MAPRQIVSVPGGGANHVWLLGDRLVLRIPRNAGPAAADLRKEAVVIPAARTAGVVTPAIVHYDQQDPATGGPVMLLERCPGVDLGSRGLDDGGQIEAAILDAVGRQLARLHRITLEDTSWSAAVPFDADDDDPHLTVKQLVDAGLLDRAGGAWLRSWFERLAPWLPEQPEPVLIHGDLAYQNLIAVGDRLTGIIDWGDAAWADPAFDFAKLRLDDVDAVLAGYLDEGGYDADRATSWRARILRHHLAWAIGRLEQPKPFPGARHWSAPPFGRFFHLVRFFQGAPPAGWAPLAPPR